MQLPSVKLSAAAIVTSLLGCFQLGYHLGVINVPADTLKDFINVTFSRESGRSLQPYESDSLWAFMVNTYQIGAVLGSFATAFFAEKFGRKISLMVINNVVAIVANLLMFGSNFGKSWEMLAVGRLLIGFNAGMSTGLLSMYLLEISPDRFRGLFGSLVNVFLNVAILLSEVFSLPQLLGNDTDWPYLMGLGVVPAVLQIALSPLFPESPKFLLINRGNQRSATEALHYFQGKTVDLPSVFAEFTEEKLLEEDEATMCTLVKVPHIRYPIVIGVIANVAQNISGIAILTSFSTSLFKGVGVSDETADWATIAMGILSVLSTFFSGILIERFGRRPLLIGGNFAVLLCLTLFVVVAEIHSYLGGEWLSVVGICLIELFVVVYNLGPGPIPWFITSELTPQHSRSIGAALSTAANWITAILVTQIHPVLILSLGNYAFLLQILPCFILTLWLHYRLPETSNKSIAEISVSLKSS